GVLLFVWKEHVIGNGGEVGRVTSARIWDKRRKSMAENTPTHLPRASTTGAPPIWFCSSSRAASRSGISSGNRTTSGFIRSPAVRACRGLLFARMMHLFKHG